MNGTRDITDMERLAIAQALFKAISSVVSTKDPDSLRGRVDARAIENYKSTGAKSFDLTLNGTKVGSFSVRLSRAVHRVDFVVGDREACLRWCVENGLARTATTYEAVELDGGLDKSQVDALDLLLSTGALKGRAAVASPDLAIADAKRHFEETGELPDGCALELVDEPSVPIGTLLKVDPALVAQAMGNELSNAVAGLLAEGAELS